MIIRNFQKGRVHNLYDKSKHKSLQGVLLFTVDEKKNISEFVEQVEETKVILEENRIESSEKYAVPVSVDPSVFESTTMTLDRKSKKNTAKKNSLIERFFVLAFVIDKYFLWSFKLVIKLFDALFKKVDRIIDWFDSAIIEGNLFHSFKFPTFKLSRRLLPISPFTKKPLIASKLKNTIEVGQHHSKKVISKAVANAKQSKPTFSLPRIDIPLKLFSFPKLRLMLALICFFISLGSIGLVMFPLVSAEVYSMLQFGVEKPSPTPTPFRYNSYYQEEKDKLYPITEFRLSVPKINLESNIVDNVDPKLEDEYKEKLQFGVAHAKGSYLPAENGTVYLFAHSTDTVFNIARFNAKFFSVRELEKGDEIKINFNGKEYVYLVEDKYVINPKEVDIIQQAKTDLILQTCWPPGTDWQRLIVTASRKDKVQTN